MKTFLAILLRPLLKLMARLLLRVEFQGDPATFQGHARLLIIANHESLIDGLLLGLFLPVNPVFVVYTGALKNPFFRLVLSFADYLTVDPSNPMGMKRVLRLVESGRPVVIFPEGRITLTGSLMKVYDGPAFVAAHTGASIIPVRLEGAKYSYFSRLNHHHPRKLFPQIRICVLPARTIEVSTEGKTQIRRRRAGDAMRRIMEEMLFASTRITTLYEALCDAIQLHGRRRPMLEDLRQTEYRYQDVLKMTLMLGRLAARLAQPGDAIGVMLPNMAPTVALVLGLSAQGRRPALLNYTSGLDGLRAACAAAQIRTLITSRAFIEQAKLQDKLTALGIGVRVHYLEDLRNTATLFDKLWLMIYALWRPRCLVQQHNPESPAVILFTSGSEGSPKGVVLSHRAVLSNIAQIRAVFAFSPEDKIFNALPIFHSLGLTAGALLPLLSGTPFFLYPTPLHYRIIPELVYDRGCSVLFGTSTFLGNYARFAHPYDFYRLRIVVAGAEKLATPVREAWQEKFGLRIFEGYGATETAPVIAVNTPMANRSGSVGQLLPGMRAQLIPVPGITQGGMLHVCGPNLMSGYLKADAPGQLQAPHSCCGPDWYETGDVVEIDEAGYIRIVGRVKRFAKVAGEMVSLEAVEKLAYAAAPNTVHAATTQLNPQRGETIVLYTLDAGLTRESLQVHARGLGLSELVLPRKIIVVDALPVLGTGKTDYVTLKLWAEQVGMS